MMKKVTLFLSLVLFFSIAMAEETLPAKPCFITIPDNFGPKVVNANYIVSIVVHTELTSQRKHLYIKTKDGKTLINNTHNSAEEDLDKLLKLIKDTCK